MENTKDFLNSMEELRKDINAKSAFIQIADDDESATIELKKPLKKNDSELTSLSFRAPKWRDLQNENVHKIISENSYSDLMRIACRISNDNLNRNDVGELGMIDSGGIIKLVSYFLSLIVIAQV